MNPAKSLLLAFALGLSVASVAHAQNSNSATNPVPRNPWLDQHNGFNAIAKKGEAQVVFLGDSITAGWIGNGKAVWAERFAPLKAVNFGIGGDATQHVLWRVRNGNFDGLAPKVVVLMIGTNNTGPNNAAQIAEGVTAVVKEIEARTPKAKILLLGIFPRGATATDSVRLKVDQINDTIAKLDDGKRVFFLNINPRFLRPDGVLSRDIMPDLVHLSTAGYQIWADAIQDKLAELLE